MEEHYLKSRGISYRSNGIHPGKKTLLFIHGLSGSASAWAAYEDYFAKNFNVITFDLRGHALSQRPRHFAQYAVDEFVADIDHLLQELRVGTVHLVSHSFGTMVAREYALRYPREAASITLLAAPYRMHDTWHRYTLWLAFVARAVAELWPLPLQRGKRLDYSHWGYSPDWQLSRIVPEIYQMGVRSYLRCLCRQYADTNLGWDRLSMPALVMHGTRDHFVPVEQARKLAAALPHAQLHILKDANHMLVLNNAAKITATIAKFVG